MRRTNLKRALQFEDFREQWLTPRVESLLNARILEDNIPASGQRMWASIILDDNISPSMQVYQKENSRFYEQVAF